MKFFLQYFRIPVSFCLFLCVILLFLKKNVSANPNEISGEDDKPVGRYQVAKLNFDHVSDVYAITLWILLGSLAKVGESETKAYLKHKFKLIQLLFKASICPTSLPKDSLKVVY